MAYEFPPLTPGDMATVAARVAAVLEDAWQRLAAHQAAVIAAIGNNERSRMVADQLAQFQAAMVDFRRRVDAEALAFVSRQLPHLYEEGARAAVRAAGGHFTWTLIHREALQSLASDSYADFLRRSEEQQRMAASFYRAVREAARREVPQLAASHTTALQAAKALADRLAAEHQLTYVIYRNGARSRCGRGRRRRPSPRVPSPTTRAPSTGPARWACSGWRYSTVSTVAGPATRTPTRPQARSGRSKRLRRGRSPTRGARVPSGLGPTRCPRASRRTRDHRAGIAPRAPNRFGLHGVRMSALWSAYISFGMVTSLN